MVGKARAEEIKNKEMLKYIEERRRRTR
jgi:hypothetical protein